MEEFLQSAGYIITLLISIGTFIFAYMKDKSNIKKTTVETEEVGVESDRQDSKLSLDWAMQFKSRMEALEDDNRILRTEQAATQKQMTDLIILNTNQNARIIKLESEVTTLTKENGLLKKRIKELEDENKKLKGDT